MPNWCSNTVTIGCTKTETLNEIMELINTRKEDEGIFQATVGLFPKKYSYDKSVPFQNDTVIDGKYFDWYNHNVNEYGTKWDVDAQEISISEDYDCITLHFDSAWSPPTEWARKLSDKFKVRVVIEYAENGCDFGGRSLFKNGDEKEFTQYTYLNWMLVDDTSGTRFMDEIEYLVSDMDKDEFEEYKQDIIESAEEELDSTFVKTVVDVFDKLEKNMFEES